MSATYVERNLLRTQPVSSRMSTSSAIYVEPNVYVERNPRPARRARRPQMARIGTRGGWIVALGLTLACTPGAPAGGAGPAAPPPAAGPAPPTAAGGPAAPATETARTPLKLKVGLVPGTPSAGIYLGL